MARGRKRASFSEEKRSSEKMIRGGTDRRGRSVGAQV